MRQFYHAFPVQQICQTLSDKSSSARKVRALAGLPNKILATEYRTVLPDEKLIAGEIEKTRRQLEMRQRLR